MKRWAAHAAAGLLLAAACACSNPKPSQRAEDAEGASTSVASASAVASADAGSREGAEVAVDAKGDRPSVGGVPKLGGAFLLPPATPGESAFQVHGCLAVAEPSEDDAAKFPPPPPPGTRAPGAKPPVQVATTAGGIVVEHELRHACCLKGAGTARVEGSQIVVTERLTGTPCRCLCGSTLRTAVGLRPGQYTLKVEVDENGTKKVAWEGEVTAR